MLRLSNIAALLLASSASVALGADGDVYETKFLDFACDVDKGNFDGSSLTVETLKATAKDGGQEKLDRIYAQLKSGPIPSGFYNGTIIFGESENTKMLQRLRAALGMPPINADFIKKIGEGLWKGKVFKPDPMARDGVPSAILANKMPAVSIQGFFQALNISSVATQNLTNDWRFPAKVFCGQSLLDSRRESIVIDYAHSDSVKDSDTDPLTRINYVEPIDKIADRNNFQVRDEIRMVKPGLYLGRAYLGRVFVLNFVLECTEGACLNQLETADACFTGAPRVAGAPATCEPMTAFR